MTAIRVVENPITVSKQVGDYNIKLTKEIANSVITDNHSEYQGTKEELLDLIISNIDFDKIERSDYDGDTHTFLIPPEGFLSCVVNNATAELVVRKINSNGGIRVVALKGERLPAGWVKVYLYQTGKKLTVLRIKTRAVGQDHFSLRVMIEDEKAHKTTYSKEELLKQYEWDSYHSYLERVQLRFK